MADELLGKPLQQLTQLSQLFATADGDTLKLALAAAAEMFEAESATLWTLNEDKTALERKEVYRSAGSQKSLRFGQGLAGLAWAEGKVRVSRQSVAIPLMVAGNSVGVIELCNCKQEPNAENPLFSVIAALFGSGTFMVGWPHQMETAGINVERTHSKIKLLEDQVRDLKQRLSKEHDQSVQSARYHTQFLSHISRDIRTPLSGITSIAELLNRLDMPQDQRDFVDIIRDSAESVLSVLEEVVEFNRHENEQFWPSMDNSGSNQASSPAEQQQAKNVLAGEQLKKARVLVVSGLLGSAEFIEAYATASGIKCEGISRGQSAITMMKQADFIGQPYDVVFVERLLPDMDAFEFARRIKEEHRLADTKLILVSTFDSAARDDHALRSGFTEHIAKPTKQQQVLTTLTAVLQGRPQPTVVQPPQQLVKDQLAPAVARGQRMILVAEDNPVNQKVALLQLRELGFFATVVANGREAIDVLKQADFDAVLMDVQMPELDGLEATKQIREWEKTAGKHVPIIAMTASASASDRDKCLAAGMDDYLSKPVTYDKLDSVLFKWVESEEGKKTLAGEKTMQEPMQQTQSMGASQADLVDLKGLEELLGPEEALEVLNLFVNSTEELISAIMDASTRHDCKALKEAAHQLKGAASSVGANSIARACLDLEACARNDDWSGVPKLNDGLSQNFQIAKTYIQSLNS